MSGRMLLAVLCAVLASPAQAEASSPAQRNGHDLAPVLAVRIGALSIRLEGCRLTWTGNETGSPVFPATVTARNCQFARAASGQVQVVDVGGRQVAMVVSPEHRPGGRWCDNAVRAVIVGDGSVRLSDAVQVLRTCSTGPFDHKLLAVLGRGAGDTPTPNNP